MSEERRTEYFLCPFGDTAKPRLCPAKHVNAGWKCPLERAGECSLWKLVELLERAKVGF
ncbi:MAG: hypothetical protein ACUVQ3_08085 [bacterium]